MAGLWVSARPRNTPGGRSAIGDCATPTSPADFPTAAQINIQVFRDEGGGDVDGVIQFTPVAIEDVLRITGPIYIADYGETITADNLEAKLHYYQLDPAGIAKQQQLNPGDTTHSLRKRFTQLLAQVLQEKVRQLPASQLQQVARALFADLRARDVQIYVTNPQVESLLATLHATGAVDTTPGLDGYMLAQANVSAAKSSPYVQITQRDDITLDDQGGATHRLTIQFDANDRSTSTASRSIVITCASTCRQAHASSRQTASTRARRCAGRRCGGDHSPSRRSLPRYPTAPPIRIRGARWSAQRGLRPRPRGVVGTAGNGWRDALDTVPTRRANGDHERCARANDVGWLSQHLARLHSYPTVELACAGRRPRAVSTRPPANRQNPLLTPP